MFRKSAERAYDKFQKGDNFIAVGENRPYPGNDGEMREQFVAARIGHDNNLTRYTVDRRRPERAAAQRDSPAREQVQQALAEREAELDPETPATASTGQVQREAVARWPGCDGQPRVSSWPSHPLPHFRACVTVRPLFLSADGALR